MAGFGAGIMMPPIIQRFIIDTSGANAAAAQMGGKLTAMTNGMASFGSSMARTFTLPVAAAATVGIQKYADLEKALNVTAQIAKNGEGRFEDLRAKAIELGKAMDLPNVTALEAATSMQTLAKAGFDVDAAMNAAKGALQFKVASEMDAESATDLLSNVLVTFNMTAKDSQRAANIIVAAADSSIMNVEELGVSLKYAGLSAATYGMSLEETAAAIGVLSNAGLQGSTAGTQLRMMLQKLTSPTKKSEEALIRLGIKTKDAMGNMLPFGKIIDQFLNAFKDADEATQNLAWDEFFADKQTYTKVLGDMRKEGKLTADELNELNQIFEVRAGSAARGLIISELRENSDTGKSYDEQLAEIQKNTDSVEKKLAAMMKGISGDIERFKNQWDTFLTNLGQALQTPAKFILGIGRAITGFFNDSSEGTRTFIASVAVALAVMGPLLVLAAKVITGFRVVASVFNKTGKAAQLIGNAVQGPSQKASMANKAFGSLKNTFVKLSNVAPTVAAAFDRLDGPMQRVSDAVIKAAPSYERLRDAIKGQLNKSLKTHADRIDKLANRYPKLADAVPKVAIAMNDLAREMGEMMSKSNGAPGRLKGMAEGFRGIRDATRYMGRNLNTIATAMGRIATNSNNAALGNERLAASFNAVATASGTSTGTAAAAATTTATSGKGATKGASAGGKANASAAANTAKDAKKAKDAIDAQTVATAANAKASTDLATAQKNVTKQVDKSGIVIRRSVQTNKALAKTVAAQAAGAGALAPNPLLSRNAKQPGPNSKALSQLMSGSYAGITPGQDANSSKAIKSYQQMGASFQNVSNTGKKATTSVQQFGYAATMAQMPTGGLATATNNVGAASAKARPSTGAMAGAMSKTATAAGTAAQKTSLLSRIMSVLPGRSRQTATNTQAATGAVQNLGYAASMTQTQTGKLSQSVGTKLAPNMGFANATGSKLLGTFQTVGTTSNVAAGKVGFFSRMLSNAGGGAGIASKAFGGVKGAISGVLGLVGLSPQMALVGALVAGAAYVIMNWDEVSKFLGDVFEGIMASLSTLWDGLYQGGKNMMQALAGGIKGGAGGVVNAAKGVASGIASLVMGNSPPESGPLADIDKGGKNIMDAWVAGMTQSSRKPMTAYLEKAREAFKAVQDRIKDDLRQAQADASKLKRAIDDIDFQFADAFNSIDDDARDVARILARLNKQADQIKLRFEEQTKAIQLQLDKLNDVETVEQKRKRNALNIERNNLRTQIVMAGQNEALKEGLESQLDQIDRQVELLDLEVEKKRLQNEQLAIPLEQKLAELNRQQNEQLLPLQNQVDLYQIQEDSLKEMREELEYQVDLRKRGLEKELDLLERKIALLNEEKTLNEIENPTSSPTPMGPDPLTDYGDVGNIDPGTIEIPEVEIGGGGDDLGDALGIDKIQDYDRAARDLLKQFDIKPNASRNAKDVAAALKRLQAAGMGSEEALTAMGQVLKSIRSGKHDKMFKAMGARVYDANGKMRPLGDILADIDRYGLSAAEALNLFGVQGGQAMVVLDNGKLTLEEYRNKMDEIANLDQAGRGFADNLSLGITRLGRVLGGTNPKLAEMQNITERQLITARNLQGLDLTFQVRKAFNNASGLMVKLGIQNREQVLATFAGISDAMAANFNTWPEKARASFLTSLGDLDLYNAEVIRKMEATAKNGKTAYGIPLEEARNEIDRIMRETNEKLLNTLSMTPEEARKYTHQTRKEMIAELAKVAPEAALVAARTKEEFDLALANLPPGARKILQKTAPELLAGGANLPTEAQILGDKTASGFLTPLGTMPTNAEQRGKETAAGIKAGLGAVAAEVNKAAEDTRSGWQKFIDFFDGLGKGPLRFLPPVMIFEGVKGLISNIVGGIEEAKKTVDQKTKEVAAIADGNLGEIIKSAGRAGAGLGASFASSTTLPQDVNANTQDAQAKAEANLSQIPEAAKRSGAAAGTEFKSSSTLPTDVDSVTKDALTKAEANLKTIGDVVGLSPQGWVNKFRTSASGLPNEAGLVSEDVSHRIDLGLQTGENAARTRGMATSRIYLDQLSGLAGQVGQSGTQTTAAWDSAISGMPRTSLVQGLAARSSLSGQLAGMAGDTSAQGQAAAAGFSSALGAMPLASILQSQATATAMKFGLASVAGEAGLQAMLTAMSWLGGLGMMPMGTFGVIGGVKAAVMNGLTGVAQYVAESASFAREGWSFHISAMPVETTGVIFQIVGAVRQGFSAFAQIVSQAGSAAREAWRFHLGAMPSDTIVTVAAVSTTVRQAFSGFAQIVAMAGSAAREAWRFHLSVMPSDTIVAVAAVSTTVRQAFSGFAQIVAMAGNAAREAWRFHLSVMPSDTLAALTAVSTMVRQGFSGFGQIVAMAGNAIRGAWRFHLGAMPTDTFAAVSAVATTIRQGFTFIAQVVAGSGSAAQNAWRVSLFALRNDTDAAFAVISGLVRFNMGNIVAEVGQGGNRIRAAWKFGVAAMEFDTRAALGQIAAEFTRLREHAIREMALMQQSSKRGGGGFAQAFWDGFKRLWFGSPISRAEKEMIAARERMPEIWKRDVIGGAGSSVAGSFWDGFAERWDAGADTEAVKSKGMLMGQALTEGLNNGFGGLDDAALSSEMLRAVAASSGGLTAEYSLRAAAVNDLPSERFAQGNIAAQRQATQEPVTVQNIVNLNVEKMEVRNDQDIVEISRQLESLLRQQQRFNGSARV